MTPKERQILKEMVRKEILKKIDKPIKLQDLISENYRNWEIGKVMTMKDNPPFKTPKQVEEEKLSEKRRPPKDEYFVKQVTTVSKAINDMLRIFPKTSFGKDKKYLKMLKMIDKELVNNTKKILGYNESVKEGKLTEATDSYVVWSPLLNKVYDGPVSEKKALMLIKKYAKQGQYHVGMLGTKYFNKTKLGKKNPVKEGKLNEKMDRRKAAVLLKQLGGNRFIAMTGAKGFAFSSKYMSFKIGRNSKGINFVRIGHNAKDLYDMEFGFVSVRGIKVKKKVKDVYADMLGQMFKKYTGMNVRL